MTVTNRDICEKQCSDLVRSHARWHGNDYRICLGGDVVSTRKMGGHGEEFLGEIMAIKLLSLTTVGSSRKKSFVIS